MDLERFKDFTPGPWCVGDDSSFHSKTDILKKNYDGTDRTKVLASTNINFEIAVKDAELMAAAPELLDFAKNLKNEMLHYSCLQECCNKILDSIDAGKIPKRAIMGLRLLMNRPQNFE